MLPSSKRVFKKNLESVPNDLDDATHKALDEEVLREVGLGNPSMALLLVMIAQNSEGKLDSKYGVLKVAKSLIATDVHLNDMLKGAWEAKSFKAIRNLKILRPTTLPESTAFSNANFKIDLDYSTEGSSGANPKELRTPTRTQGALQTNRSPHIDQSMAVGLMSEALEPFEKYIQCLAEGKLDCYFDSMRPEDSIPDLGQVLLPKSNSLLLHDLGNNFDQVKLDALFKHHTVHLFAVSGSGKTRLTLEGLCLHWGLYISCRPGSEDRLGGSEDFIHTTSTMGTMGDWHDTDLNRNFQVADRVFAMFVCARFFVLKALLGKLPPGTSAMTARRRWVLMQVMPAFFSQGDIFSRVFHKLRGAEMVVMNSLTRNVYNDLPVIAGDDIFPLGQRLCVVIDEAQQGVEYLKESFLSISGSERRPVLRPFHNYLMTVGYFRGVILAGTGLSMDMLKNSIRSSAAKLMEQPKVFVNVGRFRMDNADHENYIHKYLPSLDPSVLERILYWFTGRYRFTASLIELLLETKSPHRVLSAFAQRLTGFIITDALDLEELEPPLLDYTLGRIQDYEPVGTAEWLFQTQEHINLVIHLSRALFRWRMGSQASIRMDEDMNDIITMGIGHGETCVGENFRPENNGPAYLCEPLAVLYLSSLFEKYTCTEKKSLMKLAFATQINNHWALEFTFEEAVLLVMVHIFGDKVSILSDAFHTDQPWGSRKVTLVSLKRRCDGIIQSCPVSWSSGSSDCLSVKAASPQDVLDFLDNPGGKCFLFPDVNMGSDLVFFLQDVETMELICVPIQDKLKKLTPAAWKRAVQTVTPKYFYTVKTEDGDRKQHAPVKYPNLQEDIGKATGRYLGAAEYKPVVPEGKPNLRSSTKLEKVFTEKLQRETPKVLRIIATLDINQGKPDNLLKEEQGGDLGVLRWERMEECFGLTIRDALQKSLVRYSAGKNKDLRECQEEE